MALTWRDTPLRYGVITRILHWGMAAIFAWQFLGMILRNLLGRGPVAGFFVGSHTALGTLLLLLVLLRGAWGLYNRPQRPPQEKGWLGRAALAGHLAIYALMLVVPALALLRAYGSGRPFAPFGIPLFDGFPGGPIGWMTAPAHAAHGLLAWALLALIAGHVAMALAHRLIWRDDVLQRMAGPARPPAAAGE